MASPSNRQEFSAKVKVAAFKRDHGRCQECNKDLAPGDVFYDHIIADANGGQPTLDNCQCLCRVCHKLKTDLVDTPKAAKTKRMEAKHIGAAEKGKPIPGKPLGGQSAKRAKHPMELPPRQGGIGRQFVDA